jgi:hypothetical protein
MPDYKNESDTMRPCGLIAEWRAIDADRKITVASPDARHLYLSDLLRS